MQKPSIQEPKESKWAEMREEGRKIFFKRMCEMYGGEIDLSRVEYFNSQTKVELRCVIHDEVFLIKPNNAVLGKTGCRQCAAKKRHESNPNTLTQEEFIAKCKEKHGDKYDYSKTVYRSAHSKVTIGCLTHGDFQQTARSHHQGMGCKKCGNAQTSEVQKDTTEEFIAAARKTHGDKYDYSEVDYKGNLIPVSIKCRQHGPYMQSPKDHKQGCGCTKCGVTGPSMLESEIADFIAGLGFEIIASDRELIAPKELDIVVPSKSVAIEFNGVYYHSEKFLKKNYHLDKLKDCNSKGIDLIQIFEDEWEDATKRDIVKSIISSRLGANKTRIFARNTKRCEVSSREAREFLEGNHVQGFAAAGKYHALKDSNNEIVSLIAISKPRKAITQTKDRYDVELVRFANKKFTTVVGGFSKLLSVLNGAKIITYCDRRLFNGSGYEAVGFSRFRENPPEYYYLHKNYRNKRLSRLGFQRKCLAKKLENFDPNKTEHQNMLEHGYTRIYGCGTIAMVRG